VQLEKGQPSIGFLGATTQIPREKLYGNATLPVSLLLSNNNRYGTHPSDSQSPNERQFNLQAFHSKFSHSGHFDGKFWTASFPVYFPFNPLVLMLRRLTERFAPTVVAIVAMSLSKRADQ
jgi:hypothetical protein